MKIKEYGVKILKNGHNKLYVKEVYNYHTDKLDSTDGVCNFVQQIIHLDELAEEHVYMIAMNKGYKILGVFQVAHGVVDSAIIRPREVLIRALLCGAYGVVLIHNHPGETIDPSREDYLFTRKMGEACRMIGIAMIDSLIITRESYRSIMD